MTKTEKRIIRNCIARLQGERASDALKVALNDVSMRLFLKTWVIGPLELIAADERRRGDVKLADDLAKV